MKLHPTRLLACLTCAVWLLAATDIAHAQAPADEDSAEVRAKPRPARTSNARAKRGPNNDPGQKIAPIPPAELLPLLPSAPDAEWKLTASRAYNELTEAPRIMTFAKRDFKRTPPPPANPAPGAPAPQPQTLTLTVLDIADDPERIGDLTELEKSAASPPAPATDQLAFYKLGKLSVRETGPAPGAALAPGVTHGRRLIVAALRKRFLIVLNLTNTSKEEAHAWLNRVDLAKLTAAAATPRQREGVIPGMEDIFTLHSVDELNPKGNQTTQISRVSPEEMARREASGRAQFQKKDPAPPDVP
ncbi:hypothetical protein DB346_20955 [Verrucomicrobia bacterium LW23]|nr:hypothetical protein DB346_20955 [Verrucomicrobia bacterium LW23]